jgi:hypothetical protein
LDGLRFDVVIGLYAIAMNFMEVMQDLLTIQLEHQESQSNSLAILYGPTPRLSMITTSPVSSIETDNSESTTPTSIPSVQPISRDWGRSVQYMLRWPCIYCPEQIEQQTMWELDHPASDHDYNDCGDIKSCDSIDSQDSVVITQPYIRVRPSNQPMSLTDMNLTYLRDQKLSVAPATHPDMSDAIHPSPPNPLYPGIGDHPRSTLRLSRTHCLQAPSDEIATAFIRYQQQHQPGDYHIYIEGDNVDDRGRDTPSSVNYTRQVGVPEPVNDAILALNTHNQRYARSLTEYADDLPDLLPLYTKEQLAYNDAITSVQPFTRICGAFRTFPTPNEDRRELTSSLNMATKMSVNLSQKNQLQSTPIDIFPSMYWSAEGIDMSNTSERIVRAQVLKALAINSPNLTKRLYANNPVLALLPPMDESRVRQWLRELYPYEFRAPLYINYDESNSLVLEEIRYLYQALLGNHIRFEWFRNEMFAPTLVESLALVLRNPHDRFMLDYYDTYDHNFPHVQSTHRLIWRTVLEHIAYNNQYITRGQWQMIYHEANNIESQLAFMPNHMDNVINRLLAGYQDLPLWAVPSSSTYATGDPDTYDTLNAEYKHRSHPMIEHPGEFTFLSYTDQRTQMISKQSPLPSPPLQGWPIDRDYLRFQLSPSISPLNFSDFYHEHGHIYNLISLYATHNGPLHRLQTNSAVRNAIANELRRNNVRHNYNDNIDVTSKSNFDTREFRCLLQALLGGTLLPSQYAGRMLPFGLIGFLRSHVDTSAQVRFEYALMRLDRNQCDVRLLWSIIESDTIIDLATSAYTDLPQWFENFSNAIQSNKLRDPTIFARNSIIVNEPSFASEADTIVAALVEQLRSHRMNTIRNIDIHEHPPHSPSTSDSCLANLERRLIDFHQSIINTPPRCVPYTEISPNQSLHKVVDEQYDIALLSPYGQALHTRDATYMRRQEFLFNANIADRLARLGNTSIINYDELPPFSASSRSLMTMNDISLLPQPQSSYSHGIITAHEEQQALQRRHIASTGITSNTAATILAMNNQTVLDAACSVTGSSSRRLQTINLGILRPTVPLPNPTAFVHQYPPRPKPLNFGLDRREREMLNRQNLAITAMQNASSIPLSVNDARAMLVAADNARSTGWLNIVDDTESSSPSSLSNHHVSTPDTLIRLRQANNPPPAHGTRTTTTSHDPNRG